MDTTKRPLGADANLDTILYRAKQGSNLTRILQQYHPHADADQLQALATQTVKDNPLIREPNSVRAGQLVKIRVPSQYCASSRPFQKLHTVRSNSTEWVGRLQSDWDKVTSEERTTISSILPAFMSATGVKLSMLDTTLSTNKPLLNEMVSNYESFKGGKKTKGQYDYQRRKLVEQFTKNLGPTNLLINGGQPPTEVLRISTTKGTTPTEPIPKQLRRMKNVARMAKGGSVALSVLGLGMTCSDISQARRRDEKNEILVESAGALFGGVMYGIGTSIGIALLATPVGWVTSLVLGAGGMATSYLFGQGTEALYAASGKKIDFVRDFGVDNVCSPNKPLSSRKTPLLSDQTLAVL